MATPQQIAEQVALERDQIRQGLKRLHSSTKELESKNYASASIYGCSSIKELLPIIIERIEEENFKITHGWSGKYYKDIHNYLNALSSEAIALITCKVAFDKILSTRPNENVVNKISLAIGTAIEAECQLNYYEKTVPGILRYIKNTYWHGSSGTQHKYSTVKTKMGHYDIEHPWESWSNLIKVRLGGHYLDMFTKALPWFQQKQVRHGRHSTTVVEPTPEFIQHKDDIMKIAELFSPLLWPMLIPPKNWEYYTDFDGTRRLRYGGYYLNEVMKGNELVRNGKSTIIQGNKPLAFLNQIQEVGFKINKEILEVAENLFTNGISVGKFIPIIEAPMPPKPFDIEENKESRKAYNRKAAEAHNANSQAFRKSCRTRMTMEAARRFKNEKRFFIPWSFDYRGRTYPIPAFLTPQDTDFGKALIKFADEAPVSDEVQDWLAFQVATTFGKDKDTWEDRQAWVKENETITLISSIACDPVRHRPKWESVEEPWQFLAACIEYYHCVLIKDWHTTCLPIAIDATCSGLQILSALARDRSTAKLVNVIPSPKPQDAYKSVASQAKPKCPVSIQPYMDRKTVKRVVMTVPYNAKPYSNRQYIRDALKDRDIEVSNADLTATVKAVREAMNIIVPGPMRVMKWIEDQVTSILKDGKKHLEWTTPSGFRVHQEVMKYDKKNPSRVQLQLLGGCTLQLNKLTDNPNIDRHRAATAPNLIHSLDATLLHKATLNFKHPIALIHDSVLCRANNMYKLNSIVRETYKELFTTNNCLEKFAADIGADTENLPITGDKYFLNSVVESTYFFC